MYIRYNFLLYIAMHKYEILSKYYNFSLMPVHTIVTKLQFTEAVYSNCIAIGYIYLYTL